ncbi:unnamed protein product [Ranitomeya imitator]|uniref:GIY-YIG endonuclease n=1 Tax=Ranitomeya imitator TaxID=111125 RepID=A0ABN9M0D5_9NEOB|nr:unnamed protein product [Ranitomeya imitator]
MYANLFLGYWEREIFGEGVQAASHAQCWYRYIDDIFVVWQGTEPGFRDLIRELNSNPYNIKLTYTIDAKEIDSLDIKILVDSVGNIQSDVFRKATSVNSLLHATSAHLSSTIKAVPNIFGAPKQRWGCFPCGSCLACHNIDRATYFTTSDGGRDYRIVHYISCSTTFVVYYAVCPCNLIYVGLTSLELRTRTREHVRDIVAAKTCTDPSALKTIPGHFRLRHNCDPTGLRIRGIDKVHMGTRGGNSKQVLAQLECRWIVSLNTMSPHGLNEKLSFAPFL